MKKKLISYNTLSMLTIKFNYIKNIKFNETMFWKLNENELKNKSLIRNISLKVFLFKLKVNCEIKYIINLIYAKLIINYNLMLYLKSRYKNIRLNIMSLSSN